MQARVFLAVAAMFLISAVTQWTNAEDTSDRIWAGALAVIAISVGIYFYRVLQEERPPDDDPPGNEAP
jgi:hypothetical protein